MTNVQAPTSLEDLPKEELLKILKRDRFVKEQQGQRIGMLMSENLELAGLLQEQGEEIMQLREMLAVVGGETQETTEAQ